MYGEQTCQKDRRELTFRAVRREIRSVAFTYSQSPCIPQTVVIPHTKISSFIINSGIVFVGKFKYGVIHKISHNSTHTIAVTIIGTRTSLTSMACVPGKAPTQTTTPIARSSIRALY